MIKATDLKGKAVVALDTAEKIGEVGGIYIRPEEKRIVGIRLRSPQFSDEMAISISSIRNIGEDAVTIPSASLLQHPSGVAELSGVPDFDQLRGARVVTESGKLLGNISNVYLDPETHEVDGYELGGGLWDTLTQNRPSFEAQRGMRFGKDILVVPDAVEGQLEGKSERAEEQPGLTAPEHREDRPSPGDGT